MRRPLRLRSRQDFAHLRAEGRTLQHPLLVVSYLPNGQMHNRYGFIVSRRIGTAVQRNRIRRLLREALRRRDAQIAHRPSDQANVATGCDVAVIARAPLVDATYAQIDQTLVDLLQRAGLLPPSAD